MSSLSGAGSVGGFRPISSAASESVALDAKALLGELKAIAEDPDRLSKDLADTFGAWAGDWLKSYPRVIDNADGWNDNVAEVVARVLQDGEVSTDDVKALVREVSDFGKMQTSEREALTSLLRDHAARFHPAGRQALADLLGVENPLPTPATTPTGPTDGPPETAASIWSSLASPPDLNLDASRTRRPVALGDNYRFTAEPDVDAKTPKEVGSGLFAAASLIDDTASNLFDSMDLDAGAQRKVFEALKADLATVPAGGGAPAGLTDLQALQLRSSGATVLLEQMTAAGADPAVQREAFALYREMIGSETNPQLKDGMVFHLDRLRASLPTALHGRIDDTMEVVKPNQPPYDEWFKDGNDTVKIEWVNGDREAHDITMKQLKANGFEVVSESGTNATLKKEVTENGVTTKFEVSMRLNRGNMYNEVEDDGDSDMVVYSGHSDWGRNMRTALSGAETGEKGGAGKLVLTDLCVGKGEIQMFRDRFPNADLVTTHNSSYYSVGRGESEGNAAFNSMIADIGKRRGYEAMAENVRRDNPWAWDHERSGIDNNFIFPSDLKTRRKVLDQDHDGQADVFDRLVSFDTFNVAEDTAREFEPITPSRPAESLVGTKVHFAAQTINRLVLFSDIHRDANSTGNVIPGGYFEPGPDDASLFRFEDMQVNGEDVVVMRMNSRFSHMSEEALRMAASYEYNQHMAESDPSWRLDEAGTVLSGLVLASHSLYTDAGRRDAVVWREFLSAYNLPEIPRSTVERAKKADSHSYSGSYQSIDQLKSELDADILSQLTQPGAGRPSNV